MSNNKSELIPKSGVPVYYLAEGRVHSGHIKDVTCDNHSMTFTIDSYGGCEGHYEIAAGEIGHTVFYTEEDAKSALSS